MTADQTSHKTETIALPTAGGKNLTAQLYIHPDNTKIRTDSKKNVKSKELMALAMPAKTRTLVIMLHHFPGYRDGTENVFSDLQAAIADIGFDSIRFDYRGCGDSQGKEEDFSLATASEDYKALLNWAEKRSYDRFFVIGEGLGCTVALTNKNIQTRGLIFLWPVLDPANAYAEVLEKAENGWKDIKSQGYFDHGSHKYSSELIQNFGLYDPVKHIVSIDKPLLIQHGHKDTVSPISQLDLLHKYDTQAKRIELTTYDEGENGIHKPEQRRTMIYHVSQFLSRFD